MASASAGPPHDAARAAVRDGLIFGLLSYSLWGLFPLYLKLLSAIPPTEILAHRIVWSVPFGALLIFLRKQWPEVKKALADKRVIFMLLLSACAIAFNWGIYVWAVVSDRVLEASLGYYINPLMSVAAGVFILGEKLRRAQIVAVILAAVGVLVLTVGAGVFPWVSLTLAALFASYGFIRKTVNVGAMPGLFIEVMLLSPIALFYLLWLGQAGTGAFLAGDSGMNALLVIAGPVTVIPLVLFALSARRVRLSTLGLMQYLAPTLQFALGLYYGETFTIYHAICFGAIWTALATFSFDAVRLNRAERLAKTA